MTTMLEKAVDAAIMAGTDAAGELDWPSAMRAALLAIREPSEAMIRAGQATGNSYEGCDPEDDWPAMIDAILNEGETT